MASYATVADLYAYGLPRGSAPNPGRLAAAINSTTNAITLRDHGFAADDPITLRAEAGGSLPSPLAANTTYYALPLTADTLQLAATAGGAAIDLTTTGSRVLLISPLPTAAAIAWASAVIDDMLPAHVVPLSEPYPPIVVTTCAELAAAKLLGMQGVGVKSLGDLITMAQKRLERWSKNAPIRGENAPANAQVAASASVPYSDPRGWNRYGGL